MTRDKKYGPPWTILNLLNWTTDYFEKNEIANARFDAELLLSNTLGIDRIMLYARFDHPLEPDELASYRQQVKRRAAHEPVAYMVGTRGFWSIDLKTDSRALIPRADSEVLVEHALRLLPSQPGMKEEVVQVESEGEEGGMVDHVIQVPAEKGDEVYHVADIGTGTGALGLSLAHAREDIKLHLTDISAEALELAGENAEALGLSSRTTLHQGDLFGALPKELQFTMIVSNPPYIAESERELVSREVLDHEPHLALFAGADGLDVIRPLVPGAYARLKSGGVFMCEHGFAQAKAVGALFEEAGFTGVKCIKDLGGHDRVTVGHKA